MNLDEFLKVFEALEPKGYCAKDLVEHYDISIYEIRRWLRIATGSGYLVMVKKYRRQYYALKEWLPDEPLIKRDSGKTLL